MGAVLAYHHSCFECARAEILRSVECLLHDYHCEWDRRQPQQCQ
jgi:hypothetical protein